MNDLAVMISNMLAYTLPPMDHHPHVDASRENRRVAAEVAAELQLGVSDQRQLFLPVWASRAGM